MEGLLLAVVDVQRRAAVGRDLDDEIVEGAAGVVAGDLEDEVAAGARPEPEPFVGCEELGAEHRRHRYPLDIVASRKYQPYQDP